MSDIILHHYWTSPYAAKVHAVLGYKRLRWLSCEVGVIPPRPSLDPFLAPFRRTPVMQIGADFFCDTRLIVGVLDALAPEPTLFPPGSAALSRLVSGWAEPRVFTNIGPLRFRSAADVAAVAEGKFTAEEFFADRIPFVGRDSSRPARALAASRQDHLRAYLEVIDELLGEGGPFVCGAVASAADFSFAHTVWFLSRPRAREDLLEPFARVREWASRVQAFGPGESEPISAQRAIAAARDATTPPIELPWPERPDDRQGEEVEVVPDDYGKNPLRGTLVTSTRDHIAVERKVEGGCVARIHFPRLGYEVAATALL